MISPVLSGCVSVISLGMARQRPVEGLCAGGLQVSATPRSGVTLVPSCCWPQGKAGQMVKTWAFTFVSRHLIHTVRVHVKIQKDRQCNAFNFQKYGIKIQKVNSETKRKLT